MKVQWDNAGKELSCLVQNPHTSKADWYLGGYDNSALCKTLCELKVVPPQ